MICRDSRIETDTVLFISSSASSFTNGQTLLVDGGYSVVG